MLGIFSMIFFGLLIFSPKLTVLKISFRNTISVTQFGSRSGPTLCYHQQTTKSAASRQRVEEIAEDTIIIALISTFWHFPVLVRFKKLLTSFISLLTGQKLKDKCIRKEHVLLCFPHVGRISRVYHNIEEMFSTCVQITYLVS